MEDGDQRDAQCLTGCAINEVLGMVLATWWGWDQVPSVLLAVALPLLRRSLAFSLVVALVLTVPANRWLIARGRGHAEVHDLHGGHAGNQQHDHACDTSATGCAGGPTI